MLWLDLLAALDIARSQIRSERNLKDTVSESDPIIELLFGAITGANCPVSLGEGLPASPGDAPPVAVPSAPVIIESVERGNGEGRMLVFAREPKAPRKPPVLEEVFDEKDLG